jgi:hypothetical protein
MARGPFQLKLDNSSIAGAAAAAVTQKLENAAWFGQRMLRLYQAAVGDPELQTAVEDMLDGFERDLGIDAAGNTLPSEGKPVDEVKPVDF